MENELRFYLKEIKRMMEEPCVAVPEEEWYEGCTGLKPFVPTYIVTAVKLPTGAIELAINNTGIAEKIDYILEAYDDNMCLKTNDAIQMQNIMIV